MSRNESVFGKDFERAFAPALGAPTKLVAGEIVNGIACIVELDKFITCFFSGDGDFAYDDDSRGCMDPSER